MTRIQKLPGEVKESIQKHSLLKVIAGLNNFDVVSVERVARAAAGGGADLLDVA